MILRKLLVSLIIGSSLCFFSSGQESADSVRYLYNEASRARVSGDFLGAEIYLKRILDGDYDLPDYNQAIVRKALGYAYYETGRLEQAYHQYRMAEGLLSETDPGTLPLRISIQINLAIYYKDLGDYTNALEYNNAAILQLNAIPAWDEDLFNYYSAVLLNQGITLYHLGRYEEALRDLKECEQVKESHHHPYLGSVYFNLARVYQVMGDANLSGQYYQKSIDQWTTEYNSGYYELANVYLHFGQFLAARGKNEQGLGYLKKALQNYTQNYGPVHPLTAACYESLAGYCLDQDESLIALDYIQLALHSISPEFEEKDPFTNPGIGSSSHPLTFLKILSTKAKALESFAGESNAAAEKMANLEAALSTNLLSIDLLHRIQGSYLSGESRIYLNARQKDLFTTGIGLNLEMFDITGSKIYEEQAFLMAARGKSNELIFEMNQQEWLYLESLTDTTAVSVTGLKQRIDHYSNLIQTETMNRNPDSALIAGWRNQLFQSQDSFNRQMEQLRSDLPQIGQFESTGLQLSMNQVRRNLNRNETLIEYFVSGADSATTERLYIFTVSRNGIHFYLTHLDPAFHQNLETVTNNLQGYNPFMETAERFDSLKVALYGIYREIVQPVEPWIGGRDLVIVPDEMLSYIPFDALVTQLEDDSITNYAGVSYLLNDYNISYVYNSQLINRKRSGIWRFPDVTAWIPQNRTGQLSSSGDLQGAEEEVRDILKVVKGHSIRRSLKKPEVVSMLQEPSVLHLAMHSLATENGGVSPYFILDSITDPGMSNRMHDYEINALRLSTPMVVLSSCETAGGQLRSGEGIMSLSRSFLQAGAASVVHTLWPVDDAKSREIMVGFYRELKRGLSKSSALSGVKRQYLNNQAPFYTHPYYWAAFQVTGDPSPLYSRRLIILIIGSILVASLVFYWLKRRSFFRRDRASL